ncbi:brachyurin-like [Cloeon dipterum]|uniref:brachyurin-like n=1 Tax=Cloeon dipterum TaxID=197152 RepID=UPI00321FFBF4
MSCLQWLLCFALLAQVCAMGKHFGISGKIELVEHSAEEIKELSAKEQFKDTKSPDDGTDSEDEFSFNEAETQRFLEEVLRDDNDSDRDTELKTRAASKSKISCSDGNQNRVHDELRSNLNDTEQPTRILGGLDVLAGVNVLFTYNVLVEGLTILGTQNKYCGGAILSKLWILTAAQCVVGFAPIQVYAGSTNDPIGNGIVPIAGTPYVHPNFVLNTLLNDIALIKLVKPLTLGATISTIRISTVPIHALLGISLRTYGWGPADDTTALPAPPNLNFVDMYNFKKIECLQKLLGSYLVFQPNTGCLSSSEATKGICFADAGGPVTYIDQIGDSERIVGVNSYSFGCPTLYPSSYTVVLPYLGWIRSTTRLIVT